jgi:hypothetical protein
MITIEALKAMKKLAEFKAEFKNKSMLNKAQFGILLVDYKFGSAKSTASLFFKKESEAKIAMKSIKKDKFHKIGKLAFGEFIKTNANEWIFEVRGGGASLEIINEKANDLFSAVKITITAQQGTPDPDMQPDAAELAEPDDSEKTTADGTNTDSKSDDKADDNADDNADDAPLKLRLKNLTADIRAIVEIIADKSKRTPELIEKLKKSAVAFHKAFNEANIIVRTLFQKSYKFVSNLLIQLSIEPAPPAPNKPTAEQEAIFTESSTKLKELFQKMGVTLTL